MATREELELKLEAIRAKRAAEKAATDDAISLKMLENEITLDELVTANGELGREIGAVFSPHTGDMVVVRKPSKAAYRASQSHTTAVVAGQGKQSFDQIQVQLVAGCLIHPTKPEFEAIQDKTPAMLGKAYNMCLKLAGASLEDIEGK
jgi:hypothetical protein